MAWREFLDEGYTVRVTLRAVVLWVILSPPATVLMFFLLRAEGAPAWVQAIGSVGAVFVAIWISRDEIRRREVARLEESELREVERLHAAYLYMKKALEMVSGSGGTACQFADYVQAQAGQGLELPMLEYFCSLFDATLADMEAVDAMLFESEHAATAFLTVKRNIRLIKENILLRLRHNIEFDLGQVREWSRVVDGEINTLNGTILAFVNAHPKLLDKLVP